MARRRTTPEPPAPFKGAFSYINKMEVAVWRRTIDFTKFTATQMMEWLVPPDGLEHLRGAYPLVQGTYPRWDVKVPWGHSMCHFSIDCGSIKSLPPRDAEVINSLAIPPDLMALLRDFVSVKHEFDHVRTAVIWFNTHGVTPGAAKHYFPTLGALLPEDHDFHQVDGQRFKDVYLDAEVTNAIRLSAGAIAKGILAAPDSLPVLSGPPIMTLWVSENGAADEVNQGKSIAIERG